MGQICLDPFLSLADLFFALTFLVAIWYLLSGWASGISKGEENKRQHLKIHNDKPCNIYGYLLLVLFVFFTVQMFFVNYQQIPNNALGMRIPGNHFYLDNNNEWKVLSISGYILQMSNFIVIEILSLCTAILLRFSYKNNRLNKVICWGLLIQLLVIITRYSFFYMRHPPVHRMQFIEAITTLLILIASWLFCYFVAKHNTSK